MATSPQKPTVRISFREWLAFIAAQGGDKCRADQEWNARIKVRMVLHTGTAELRDGGYFGQVLNRAARILSTAHGGQVLLSLPTEEIVRDVRPAGICLRGLGEHRLRDLARSEHLFQLAASDLPSQFPALRSFECALNNLPSQLTSFIVRERELAEVKRLLGIEGRSFGS